MEKALITGIAGQDGSFLAADLSSADLSSADLSSTDAEFQHPQGDRLEWPQPSLYDRPTCTTARHSSCTMPLRTPSHSPLVGRIRRSFPQLAMRLAPQSIEIEMSGKDF